MTEGGRWGSKNVFDCVTTVKVVYLCLYIHYYLVVMSLSDVTLVEVIEDSWRGYLSLS